MTRTPAKTASATDAIAMLMDDHKKVKKMFKDFEGIKDGDDTDKSELVARICEELTLHMQIEEELFYPAARDALSEDDEDLLDEADVEHNGAKELIAQLEGMEPGDDHYDAKVTVLGEYIEHHVKEEENEMFPKLKKAKLNTTALGAAMAERKQELMDEGMPQTPPPSKSRSRNQHAAR